MTEISAFDSNRERLKCFKLPRIRWMDRKSDNIENKREKKRERKRDVHLLIHVEILFIEVMR